MEEQVNRIRDLGFSGLAAAQCGKALPFRLDNLMSLIARLRLAIGRRRSLPISFCFPTVRQSLTALCGGKATRQTSVLSKFSWQHLSRKSAVAIFLVSLIAIAPGSPGSRAQNQRSGAHSTAARDAFTASDRRLVERAIGATCAERIRDPQGSMPIDEMQSRPSLPVNNPDALDGARRADRLLPATRKLVAEAIVRLAKEYDLYGGAVSRGKINSSVARVQSVKRVKADVDARDNASVVLREPRTIEFGTIFLAGLRSDEAMISVLAHELTHIASGQTDSLRPLFKAIARRAAARTGLRIQGQRSEELACDLVGVIATREFIDQTASWEPLPRRLARAFEHNCVDDDSSDEDHLSPRSTIRALFALDVSLASELVSGTSIGQRRIAPVAPVMTLTAYATGF
jgi:hypothetical protein